jgi:hypothetical protein
LEQLLLARGFFLIDTGTTVGMTAPERDLIFDVLSTSRGYEVSLEPPVPGDLQAMIDQILDQHPCDQVARLNRPREGNHHCEIEVGVFRRQCGRDAHQLQNVRWDWDAVYRNH